MLVRRVTLLLWCALLAVCVKAQGNDITCPASNGWCARSHEYFPRNYVYLSVSVLIAVGVLLIRSERKVLFILAVWTLNLLILLFWSNTVVWYIMIVCDFGLYWYTFKDEKGGNTWNVPY